MAALRTASGRPAPGSLAWRSAFTVIPRWRVLVTVLADGVSGSEDGQQVLVKVLAGYGHEPAQARQRACFLVNLAVVAGVVGRLEGELQVVEERFIIEFGEPARTLRGNHLG
jgi:hypothetical protein